MKKTKRIYRLGVWALLGCVLLQPLQPPPVFASTSVKLPHTEKSSAAPSAGIVEAEYSGLKSMPTVFILQDAHGQPSAQKSLVNILAQISRSYSIKKAFVEGGSGKMETLILRSAPDRKLLETVLKPLQEKGELSGAVSQAVLGEQPLDYEGAEDEAVYEAQIISYLQGLKFKDKALSKIKNLKNLMTEEKKRRYSKSAFELDQKIEEADADFSKIPGFLSDQTRNQALSDYPFLAALALEFRERQSPITSAEAEEIKKRFESLEKNTQDKQALRELGERKQAYTTGRVDGVEAGLYVTRASKESFSPTLAEKIKRRSLLNQMHSSAFLLEWKRYTGAALTQKLETDEARTLHEKDRVLKLLEKCLKFELTSQEWRELSGARGEVEKLLAETGLSAETAELKPFFSFYEIAVRRDGVFKNKIVSAAKAAKPEENFIFLAGGFHTEGMSEALRANGISFKVIRPEIKEVESGETYQNLMQGKCSWLKPGEWSKKKNLHDSFIYWAAEEMAGFKNGLLKEWRDQILRTLAEREELSKAGEYTKILDEVAIKRSSLKENEQTAAAWKIRAEKFLTDLQGLISSGQLNEKNLAKLFAAPAASAPAEKPLFVTTYSEAFFHAVAGDFPAVQAEAILQPAPARSEIRILENYEGFTEFKPLVKSALELLRQEWLYTGDELKSLETIVVDETSELSTGEIKDGKVRLSQNFIQALKDNPSGARILARFLIRLFNENAAKRQGAENKSVKTIGLRQDLLRFLEETEAEREAALEFVFSPEERGIYLAAHEAIKSKENAIRKMKPWQRMRTAEKASRQIVDRVTQSVTSDEIRAREEKIQRMHLNSQIEAYKKEGYFNGASSPENFWSRASLELMRELLMELTKEVKTKRLADARDLIAKKYGVKSEELNQPISFSLHPWQLFLNDLREIGLSETSPKLIGLYDYLTRNVSEVPESLSRHTDRDKKIGLLMEFMNWNQPARIFDWSEDFTEEERNSALTKLMEFLAGDISDPDEKRGHRWNPQTMTFEETEPAAIADLPEENLLTSHWLLTQGKNLFASRYGFLGESTLRFTTGDLTQKSSEFYKNVQIASITRALQLFLGNPVFEMLQRREGESDYELAKRFTETQVKNPESGKAFAEAVSRDLVLSRNIIFIDDLRRRASSGFLKTNLEEIYAFQNLLKRIIPTLEEIETERKRPLSSYQGELSSEEALKKFGVLGVEILAEKQKMQGEKIQYARKADGQPAIFYENGKPELAVLANAGNKVTGVIVYTAGENGQVLYEDHYLISSAQEIFSEEKDLAYWRAARAPALSSRILYQDGKPALRFVLDPENQTIKGLESLENPLTEKTQTGESYAVSFQARQKELVSQDYPFDAEKTNVSDWEKLEVEVKEIAAEESREHRSAKEYAREKGLIKFIRVHSEGSGKAKQPVSLELVRFPKKETIGDFYRISADKDAEEKMKAKDYWVKADEIQKAQDPNLLTKRVFYDSKNFDENEENPYQNLLELSLEEGMVTAIHSHGYSAGGAKTHTDTHQYQNEAGEDDFALFDAAVGLESWSKTAVRKREFLDAEGKPVLRIELDPKDSRKITSITHLREIEKIVEGKKTRERVEIHFSGETLEAALQNKFHSEWTLEDWLRVLAPYELAVKGSGKDESFEKVREELLKKFENRRKLLDLALSYYISLQHQSEIEVEESWVTQVEDFVQNVLRQSLRPWIADIDERPRDLARVLRRTAVLLEDYKKELGISSASITGQIREFLPEMLGSRLWDEKDLLTALASVRSKESETEELEVSSGNFFNAVSKMLGVHEDQVSTIAAVHEKILKRAGVNLSQYHGNFNELLETSAAMQAAFWAVQYIQKQYPTDSPFGDFESTVEDDGISLVYRSTRVLGKPLAQTQIDVQPDAGSNRLVRWDNARKNAAAQWNPERVEHSLAEMAEEPEQQKKQDLVLEIYTLNGLHGSSSREAVSEKLYAGNKVLKEGGLLVVMLPANKGFSEEGIEQMAEHYGYERVEEGISYNEFSAEYRAQTAKGGETADAELEKEDLIQNQKFYVLILKKQKDISEAREFLPKNDLAVKTFPLVSSDAGGGYVKTVAPDGTIHLIPRLNIQDLIKKEGFEKLVPANPETRASRKIKAGGFRHRKPKHKEMDKRDFQYAQQQLRRIQKYRGLLFEHFKKDTTGRTRFRQLLNRTHSPQMENDRTDKFAEKWTESADSWFADDKEPDAGKWPISKTFLSEDGTRAVSLSYAPSSRNVLQVWIHETSSNLSSSGLTGGSMDSRLRGNDQVGDSRSFISAEPRKVLKETVYDKNWNYEQLVKLEGTLYAAELDLPSLMNRRRNVYLPIFENHSLLIKEVYPVLGIYSDFETWFSDDVWRSLKAVAEEDLEGHPLEAVLAPIAQERETLEALEKIFKDASRAITEEEAKKVWTLRFMMKRLLRSRKFVAAKRWGKRAPRDGQPQNGETEKIEANIISQTLRSNVSFVGASAIAKVIQSNRQAKSGERFAVLDGGSGTGAVAHALSAVGLTPQDDSNFIFHERDPSQESLDQVRPSGFQGERYKKEKKNMGELQDDAAEFYDQVSLSYIVHLLTPEQARDMYTGLNRIVKTGGEVTQAIPQSWRFTKAYLEGLRQLGWEMVEAPRRIGERASEEWIQSIKEKYGNTPEGDAIAEQVRQIKSRQFTLLRLRKISAVDSKEALKIPAEDFELEKTETGQTGKGTGERKFDFGPEALKKWLEVESWTLKDWSDNEITADDPVNGTVSREEVQKNIFPEIESEDALKHLHDLRFLFSSRQGEGNPYETISDFFIYWNSGIQQFHRKTVEELARYYREGPPALRRGPPQKLKLSRVLARLSSRARKFERLNRGLGEQSSAFKRNQAVIQEIENLKTQIQRQFTELQSVQDEWSVDFAIPKDAKDRFGFAAGWKTLKAAGTSQAEWTPRSLAGLQWFVTKIQKPGDELIAALLRNPPSIPSQKGLETVPSSPAGELPSAGSIQEETQPAAAPEAQPQTVEEKRKINYEDSEIQRQMYWIHSQILEELLKNGLSKDKAPQIFAYRKEFYRNGKIPDLEIFNRFLAGAKGQAIFAGKFSPEDLRTPEWKDTFELIHTRRALLEALRAWFSSRQNNLAHIQDLKQMKLSGEAGDYVLVNDGLMKVPNSESELLYPNLFLSKAGRKPKSAFLYLVPDPFLRSRPAEYLKRLDPEMPLTVVTPDSEVGNVKDMFRGVTAVNVVGVDQRAREVSERFERLYKEEDVEAVRKITGIRSTPEEGVKEDEKAAKNLAEILTLLQTENRDGMTIKTAVLQRQAVAYKIGDALTGFHLSKLVGQNSGGLQDKWLTQIYSKFNSLSRLADSESGGEGFDDMAKLFTLEHLVNSFYSYALKEGYKIDKSELESVWKMHLGRSEGFAMQIQNAKPVLLPNNAVLDPWSYELPVKPTESVARSEVRTEEEETEMALRLWNTNWRVMLENAKENPEAAANIENAAIYLARAFGFLAEKKLAKTLEGEEVSLEQIVSELERISGTDLQPFLAQMRESSLRIPEDPVLAANYLAEAKLWRLSDEDLGDAERKVARLFQSSGEEKKKASEDIRNWIALDLPGNTALRVRTKETALMMALDRIFGDGNEFVLDPEKRESFQLFMSLPAVMLNRKIAEAQFLYEGFQDSRMDFPRRLILEGSAEAALEPELLRVLNLRISEISEQSVVKALGGFIFPQTNQDQRENIASVFELFFPELQKRNESKAADKLGQMNDSELRVFLSSAIRNFERRRLGELEKNKVTETIMRVMIAEINKRTPEKRAAALLALIGLVKDDPSLRGKVFTRPLKDALLSLLKTEKGREAFRIYLKKRPAAGSSIGLFLIYADHTRDSQGKIIKLGSALANEFDNLLLDEIRKALLEEDAVYFSALQRIVSVYSVNVNTVNSETVAEVNRFSKKLAESVFKAALKNPRLGYLPLTRFAAGKSNLMLQEARKLLYQYGQIIASGNLDGVSAEAAQRRVRNWVIQYMSFEQNEDSQRLNDAFEKGLKSGEVKPGFQEPSALEKETIKKLVQNILYAESDSARAAAQGKYEEFVEKESAFISKEESIMRKIYARIVVLSEPVRLDFPYESYKKGMAFFHLERPWVMETLEPDQKIKLITKLHELFSDSSISYLDRSGWHLAFTELVNAPENKPLLESFGKLEGSPEFFKVPKELRNDIEIDWPEFKSAVEMMEYFNSLKEASVRSKLSLNAVKFITQFNAFVENADQRARLIEHIAKQRNVLEPLRYWLRTTTDPYLLQPANLVGVERMIEDLNHSADPALNAEAYKLSIFAYARAPLNDQYINLRKLFSEILGLRDFRNSKIRLFDVFSHPGVNLTKNGIPALASSFKRNLEDFTRNDVDHSPTSEELTGLVLLIAARASVPEAELREALQAEPGKPLTENRFKKLAEEFQDDQKKSEQSALDQTVKIPEELELRNFYGSGFEIAFQMARQNAERKLWVLSRKDKERIDQQVKAIYAAPESRQEGMFKNMMENNVRSPNRYQDWSRRIYTYLTFLRESHFGRYEYSKQKAIERLAGSLREEMPNSGFYSQKAFEGIEEAQLAAEAAQDPRLEDWQKIILRDRAHRLWESIVVQQEDADKITDLRRDLRSTGSSLNTMPAGTSIPQAWIDQASNRLHPESLETRRGSLALVVRNPRISEKIPEIIAAMNEPEEFMDYAIFRQVSPALEAQSRKVLTRLEEKLEDPEFRKRFTQVMKKGDPGIFGVWLAASNLLQPQIVDPLSQTLPRLYEVIQANIAGNDPESVQAFSQVVQNYVREYYYRAQKTQGDESRNLLDQGQKVSGIWADLLGAVTAKPEFFEGNLSKLFLAESIVITTAHNVPIWTQIAERIAHNLEAALPEMSAASNRGGRSFRPDEIQAKLESFFTALGVWGGASEEETRKILGVPEGAPFTENRFKRILEQYQSNAGQAAERQAIPTPPVGYEEVAENLYRNLWDVTPEEKSRIESTVQSLLNAEMSREEKTRIYNEYKAYETGFENKVHQMNLSNLFTAVFYEQLLTREDLSYSDGAFAWGLFGSTAKRPNMNAAEAMQIIQAQEQAVLDVNQPLVIRSFISTWQANPLEQVAEEVSRNNDLENWIRRIPHDTVLSRFFSRVMDLSSGTQAHLSDRAIDTYDDIEELPQLGGSDMPRDFMARPQQVLERLDQLLADRNQRQKFQRFMTDGRHNAAVLFSLLPLIGSGGKRGVLPNLELAIQEIYLGDNAQAHSAAFTILIYYGQLYREGGMEMGLRPLTVTSLGNPLGMIDSAPFWSALFIHLIDGRKSALEWYESALEIVKNTFDALKQKRKTDSRLGVPDLKELSLFLRYFALNMKISEPDFRRVLQIPEGAPITENLFKPILEEMRKKMPSPAPAEDPWVQGVLKDLDRPMWKVTDEEIAAIEQKVDALFDDSLTLQQLQEKQNDLLSYIEAFKDPLKNLSLKMLANVFIEKTANSKALSRGLQRQIFEFDKNNLREEWNENWAKRFNTSESANLVVGLRMLKMLHEGAEDKRLDFFSRFSFYENFRLAYQKITSSRQRPKAVQVLVGISGDPELPFIRPLTDGSKNRTLDSSEKRILERLEGLISAAAAAGDPRDELNEINSEFNDPSFRAEAQKYLLENMAQLAKLVGSGWKTGYFLHDNFFKMALEMLASADPNVVFEGARLTALCLKMDSIIGEEKLRANVVRALMNLLNRSSAFNQIPSSLIFSFFRPLVKTENYNRSVALTVIDIVKEALAGLAAQKGGEKQIYLPRLADVQRFIRGYYITGVMPQKDAEEILAVKTAEFQKLLEPGGESQGPQGGGSARSEMRLSVEEAAGISAASLFDGQIPLRSVRASVVRSLRGSGFEPFAREFRAAAFSRSGLPSVKAPSWLDSKLEKPVNDLRQLAQTSQGQEAAYLSEWTSEAPDQESVVGFLRANRDAHLLVTWLDSSLTKPGAVLEGGAIREAQAQAKWLEQKVAEVVGPGRFQLRVPASYRQAAAFAGSSVQTLAKLSGKKDEEVRRLGVSIYGPDLAELFEKSGWLETSGFSKSMSHDVLENDEAYLPKQYLVLVSGAKLSQQIEDPLQLQIVDGRGARYQFHSRNIPKEMLTSLIQTFVQVQNHFARSA